MTDTPTARWIVCEDGVEYLERFRRFLVGFELVGVASAAALWRALDEHPARGLLLDLDFRRTPAELLIDERGQPAASAGAAAASGAGQASGARVVAEQGLLILRALRARGSRLPVVLFADLDDPARGARLVQQLGPLRLAPSDTGLDTLMRWMHELTAVRGGVAGFEH